MNIFRKIFSRFEKSQLEKDFELEVKRFQLIKTTAMLLDLHKPLSPCPMIMSVDMAIFVATHNSSVTQNTVEYIREMITKIHTQHEPLVSAKRSNYLNKIRAKANQMN